MMPGLPALLVLACTSTREVAPLPPAQAVRGEAFGTTWTVKWRGERPTVPEVESLVTSVLGTVDQAMSSWRDDSELAEIRRADGPVVVSEETAEVVRAARELAEDTAGAFDPTVEPLMELWGFRGERREHPPTEEEIAAARAAIGWSRVSVSRRAGAATVDSGGTALDLSAIAKGHAVDRVAWALSRAGSAEHMVEIGGEVRVAGEWRIGVDRPDSIVPGRQFAAVIALRNAGLATSGNYRNAYNADGMRIVHTMDPRSGRPRASDVASVTVVAPSCRTADGWATALMVLDAEQGLAAVEARPELDALWLIADGEGFVEQRSSHLAHWLVEP